MAALPSRAWTRRPLEVHLTPEEIVEAGFRKRAELVGSFFASEQTRLAELCHAMAERFTRRGRLLAFGLGAAATDAQHISVEFVHPVIVGKRALPAIALPNDTPTALGLAGRDPRGFIASQVAALAGAEDIAIGMTHSHLDVGIPAVTAALEGAKEAGMLTVSLAGPREGIVDADFCFAVPSDDPFIVQEVHETLYHVLWELVHVFFDHQGVLVDRPPSTGHDTGRSSFLYPFFTEAEDDLPGILRAVSASIVRKADDVIAMRGTAVHAGEIVKTAALISERIASGGKIIAFGNGGSATDAQDLVCDLLMPPAPLAAIPALSLTNDAAVLTAVANDVGVDNIFSRQVIALGAPGDIAVAFSTSGGSRNVLTAVEEANRRGLLTVGLCGYGGGQLAGICDRVHAIEGDYIPRIQETQASIYHLMRGLLAEISPVL